ncbi:MAG: LLM class flavin-dependent oxidoreductase [Oscillochloridaceae bacterium umkhey_bin13]
MMQLKFSLRLNNDLPVAAYPTLARAAEAAGFDQFWVSDDLFLRGVWPILTACTLATEWISLGTCIVNPATCHPAELAMQAATLDELSGGRLLLGLGAGAGEFLGWIGLSHQRPLQTMAETIRRLRALLAGERGPFDGPGLPAWSAEAFLRFPSRPIPLYLAALSPRMQRLIGEVADGGLPLLFPPEHYPEVANRVQAGARTAGRDLAQLDLAACIWVSLDADRARAELALRSKIAYYANALSDDMLTRLGVPRAEVQAIAATLQSAGLAAAAEQVSPALLRLGVAGDAATLIARLQGLLDLGVRHLSFGPPLGPDPLAAIALLGQEVLPHLR